MLLVLSLGWGLVQCSRYVLSPLLPEIQSNLGFSSTAIGLALTGFGLVYAITQYPSGAYSDSLTRATLIVPGLAALVGSCLLMGVATTALIFIPALLLLGVGKGLYASPSRALIGDLFTARRGRALGIYSAATDIGGLLASGLAVLVLATTVWQVAYLPILVLFVAVMILFVIWNQESYTFERTTIEPGETTRRILSTPEQREVLFGYLLFYVVVGGLINFYPTMLVETGGLSPAVAGLSFALFFSLGMVVKPAAGDVSDRFSRLSVSICGLILAAGGLAVILLTTVLPVILLGTVIVAIGYKIQFPIVDAIVIESAATENVGGDLGAVRAVFLLGNAIGPGFVGIVADLTSFRVAFWFLTVILLCSALVLGRRYRKQ